MDDVVEIITGRERRRRWSVEDKLRIVAQTQEPGVSVRGVAVRHGICESLLFAWRRQVNEGVLVEPAAPVFMAVQMHQATLPAPGLSHADASTTPPASGRPQSGLIEIALGNGSQVRVGSDVNLAALRRVLAALRG